MTRSRDASPPIAIHLEGRHPMRGRVEDGSRGRGERFVGWLALLAALERLFNDRSEARPVRARSLKRRTK